MLALSAGATLLLTDKLWVGVEQGSWPVWVAFVAPTSFTLFAIIYSIDRYLLTRKHQYPIARALVQIGLVMMFLVALIRPQASKYSAANEIRAQPAAVLDLLKHREPRVRGAACELLGLRGEISAYAAIEGRSLRDRSEQVRGRCQRALDQLRTVKADSPTTPQQ